MLYIHIGINYNIDGIILTTVGTTTKITGVILMMTEVISMIVGETPAMTDHCWSNVDDRHSNSDDDRPLLE